MKFTKFTLFTFIVTLFVAKPAFGMSRVSQWLFGRRNAARVAQQAQKVAQPAHVGQGLAPRSATQAPQAQSTLARIRNYLFNTQDSQTGTFVVNSEASTEGFAGRTRGTGSNRKRVFGRQENTSADAKEVARPEEILAREEARLFDNIEQWNKEPIRRSTNRAQQDPVRNEPKRTSAKGKEKVDSTHKIMLEEQSRLEQNFEQWEREAAEKQKVQQEKLQQQAEKRKQKLAAKHDFQTSVARAKRKRLEKEVKARSNTMREATRRNMDTLIQEQEQKMERMRIKQKEEKVRLAKEEKARKAKLAEKQKQIALEQKRLEQEQAAKERIAREKEIKERQEQERARLDQEEHARLQREAHEREARQAQERKALEQKRLAEQEQAAKERIAREKEIKERQAAAEQRQRTAREARNPKAEKVVRMQQRPIARAVPASGTRAATQNNTATNNNGNGPVNHRFDAPRHAAAAVRTAQKHGLFLNEYDKKLFALLRAHGDNIVNDIISRNTLSLELVRELKPLYILFDLYNNECQSAGSNVIAEKLLNLTLKDIARMNEIN